MIILLRNIALLALLLIVIFLSIPIYLVYAAVSWIEYGASKLIQYIADLVRDVK